MIPFGMGQGNLESGVVQIPLSFTVGETVDFIRTVATVDRDYLRTDPATVAAGGVAAGSGLNPGTEG